jgi:tetratricopeptide (TPR) repeat protein
MPELSASGQIFNLRGSAGFDEGIVRGDIGGGARLNFDGHFELCHGLDAALSAEAVAEANAHVSLLFFLAGYAQGEALAAAGVEVEGSIHFDLFDSFGFSAEAEAYAELAVAGSLAIGITFEDIARAAKGQLNHVSYDLLIYFLNEIDIVAGVWGKAAFAAMARARIKMRGSLSDDRDAGFIIEFGAEAAAAAGAGFEFYAGLKLRNPKRFYLNSVERITGELSREAVRLLPRELAPAIRTMELSLPIALNTAYELGQTLPLNTMLPPGKAAQPFLKNFAAQLQRFIFDQLVDAGIALLSDLIRQTFREALVGLSVSQRNTIRSLLNALISDLESDKPPEPVAMVGRFADILAAFAQEQVAQWQKPITVAWLGAASGVALRDSVGGIRASGSMGLIGLGTQMGDVRSVRLPEAPRIVLDEIDVFLDPMPSRVELKHAVSYLVGNGAQCLYHLVPGLPQAIDPLLSPLNLTGDEVLRLALEGTFAEHLSETELYQKLRDFLKSAVDNEIDTRLLPELRRVLSNQSDTRIWIDEAAQPSLRLLSGFVFQRLDAMVNGNIPTSDVSPFLESFRSALTAVVRQIVIRNVVVVSDILREHVYDMLSTSFHQLSVAAASSTQLPVAVGARELARALVLPLVPLPSDYAQISARLVADLFEAASVGFDPSVLSANRRRRLRDYQSQILLSIDGSLDYKSGAAVDNFFRQAVECAYIPAPQAVVDLIVLQTEILADQAGRMLPHTGRALQRFLNDLSWAAVDDGDRMARQFIDGLLAAVEAALEAIERIDEALRRIEEAIRAARERLETALTNAANALSSSSRRTEILDAAAEAGVREARRLARSAPGFGSLHPNLKAAALETAENGFRNVFNLARPALNQALRILGEISRSLATIVDAAGDFDEAISLLRTRIREDVEAAVRRQLGVFGVALPDELGPADIAREARDVIANLPTLRDAIRGVFREKSNIRTAESERSTKESERREARFDHARGIQIIAANWVDRSRWISFRLCRWPLSLAQTGPTGARCRFGFGSAALIAVF